MSKKFDTQQQLTQKRRRTDVIASTLSSLIKKVLTSSEVLSKITPF